MPIQVRDDASGKTFEFPDDATPDQIAAAMRQHTAPAAPQEKPNAARGLFSKVGGALADIAGGIKDAYTGDKSREFDLPELPGQIVPGFGEIKGKMALAQTGEGQADIYRAAFPNSPVTQDKFGNAIAEQDGQRYYLNRPGLSSQDFDNFGANLAITAPFGLLGGTLAKGAGLLGRALGAGAGGFSGSVAQDIAATNAGSKQGVSIPRAAGNAAGAVGFEMLAPAASAAYRAIVRRPELFDPAKGTLSEAGKFTLQQAGIDPADITDDYARQFAKLARDAVKPEDAARAALAQTLPVPVPVTKGDMTRVASQQMFEDNAVKGVFGGLPENIMRGVRVKQQDALRANVEAIRGQVAGGSPITLDRTTAGQMAQGALERQRAAGKKVVDEAYDTARAAPAGLPQQEVQGLRYFLGAGEEVRDRIAHAPKARDQLAALDALTQAGGDASVNVGSLFDWRRATGKLARETQDQTEAGALRDMVRRFDEAVPEMVKDGLMSGDQTAVDAWKKAIATNREFAGKFKGNDLIQDLLEKEYRSGKMQFTVAPESATNYIFGLSDTGFVSKPDLARDMVRMRQVLGPDSTEWRALKEEAFVRLAKAGEGPYNRDITARDFSGAKFGTAFDGAMKQNPEVMRVLFSPEELKLMQQFRQVATMVTTVAEGGKNTSNTTAAAANILQKLTGNLGPKARAAMMTMAPWAVSAVKGAQAANAAAPKVPIRELPPGLVGSFGAAGTSAYNN